MRFPWDKDMKQSYEIIKYPDGTSYVKVHKFDTKVVYRINDYEDLWILGQLVDVYNHNNQEINLVIPNLIDAQADRRFNNNEPHNLKLVLKFLNGLKVNSIQIFHPHNPEVVEACLDNVRILDNSQFIINVINDLGWANVVDTNGKRHDLNSVLMSSDAGGFKPLMKLCDKIGWHGETFSASKSRKYEDGKSQLLQLVDKDDFEGKDVIIVDDICVKGGTFIGLAKLLRERNVGKLHLAVSHITVSDPNRELYDVFDTVYTTNSKGLNYYGGGHAQRKLKIIEMF